jgi:hypothetical protein
MSSFRKEASSRGCVRSGLGVSLSLSTARAPFLRAHLDRIELPADWRNLLVRGRAMASRAEVVSARPFLGAAIWYGSSPGAERQVLETEGVLKRRKVSSGVTAEEMRAQAAALRDVGPE